jgi:hypothetical protein
LSHDVTSFRRVRQSNSRKKGPPSNAVRMPTGRLRPAKV